jgi:hypothetical protein
VWNTKARNSGHVYSANLWVGGKKRPVTVDDNIPFVDYRGNGSYLAPWFSKLGKEGGFWGPIMEKMWAKMHGNYENIHGGDPREGFRALNGNPTTFHSTTSYLRSSTGPAQAYNIIAAMDKRGDVMSCGSRNGRNGIVLGHAYTILGAQTVTITRAGKTASRQMVVMRNPWASERYRGPYSDGDSCWNDSRNAAAKKALGYVKANDGRFFMEISDFLTDFGYWMSSTIIDGHQHGQLEAVNDAGSLQTWEFVAKKALTDVYFTLNTYQQRMYASGCANGGYLLALIKITSASGTTIKYTRVYAQMSQNIHVPKLAAGKYYWAVTVYWSRANKALVHDYVADVYASDRVQVYKKGGKPAAETDDNEGDDQGGDTDPTPKPKPDPTPEPKTLKQMLDAKTYTTGKRSSYKLNCAGQLAFSVHRQVEQGESNKLFYQALSASRSTSPYIVTWIQYFRLPAGHSRNTQTYAISSNGRCFYCRYGWLICSHVGDGKAIVRSQKAFTSTGQLAWRYRK